jgi:hypothetical protein
VRCKFICFSGVIILIACLFFSAVYAENDLNFNVPVPANSKFLDSKQLQMGARQINTLLYSSQEPVAAVIEYYTDFFTQQDFKKILDNTNAKPGNQILRFKKDTLVVSVSVTDKDAFTQIVIAKYLQGPNELSPVETKPSVKDSIFALPKSDVAGVEISVVPRPQPSVRIMSYKMGTAITAMYTTPLDVASAVDFYLKNMPDHGWVFLSQVAAKEATQAYMQASGKKSLGIKSPFTDGEDFEQVINDSYVLNFSAGEESAQITISPNFTSRALGSMVQVAYNSKE